MHWTGSDKKHAHSLFQTALESELTDLMAEFKRRAVAAQSPDDMWAMESFLREKRREIDTKYDYRYSQLIFVFARLLVEGRMTDEDIAGFSDDIRSEIQHIANLGKKHAAG